MLVTWPEITLVVGNWLYSNSNSNSFIAIHRNIIHTHSKHSTRFTQIVLQYNTCNRSRSAMPELNCPQYSKKAQLLEERWEFFLYCFMFKFLMQISLWSTWSVIICIFNEVWCWQSILSKILTKIIFVPNIDEIPFNQWTEIQSNCIIAPVSGAVALKDI